MHLCIQFNPDLNNLEYHKAKIEAIKIHNPTVKSFFIRYDVDMPYQSGQFVIIDFGQLPHQFSTRSYSIADVHTGSLIELCVVLKLGGAATPILFDQNIGEELTISNPQGRFILPETIEDKIYGFICTGTGVAPFRAMIKDLLLIKKCTSPVYLYFGCRTEADILYRDEFESLSRQFPNFKYIPVLSRQNWEGATGYVHEHYKNVFEQKPNALIYLCGWTEMIKQTRDNLKGYGYSRTEIKVEFYD